MKRKLNYIRIITIDTFHAYISKPENTFKSNQFRISIKLAVFLIVWNSATIMYDKKEICTFPRGILSRLIVNYVHASTRKERERERERVALSNPLSAHASFRFLRNHTHNYYLLYLDLFLFFLLYSRFSVSLLLTLYNSFSPPSLSLIFFYVPSYKLVALTLSARISPRPFGKKKKEKKRKPERKLYNRAGIKRGFAWISYSGSSICRLTRKNRSGCWVEREGGLVDISFTREITRRPRLSTANLCAGKREKERERREAHPRALGGKRVAGPLEGIVGNWSLYFHYG